MEALGPAAEGEESGYDLSTLVMYTSQQEIGSVVQTLADIGQPAVVVVDDCALATHRTLSNVVQRQGSRLSLVTIDDEVPVGTPDDSTIIGRPCAVVGNRDYHQSSSTRFAFRRPTTVVSILTRVSQDRDEAEFDLAEVRARRQRHRRRPRGCLCAGPAP